MVWALTLTISVLQTPADVALTSQNSESSDSPTRAVSELHAKVGKLLSTIEAHLVSPARNRKRSADVAVPATKDPLNQVLYSVCHYSTLRQFAFHLRVFCQPARCGSVVEANCYRAFEDTLNYAGTAPKSASALLKGRSVDSQQSHCRIEDTCPDVVLRRAAVVQGETSPKALTRAVAFWADVL